MQNSNGGYSYETKSASGILEKINPAEMFGDIMVDYTYMECTSDMMQALSHFVHEFLTTGNKRSGKIDETCFLIIEYLHLPLRSMVDQTR